MSEEAFDALIALIWVIANRASRYSTGRQTAGWLEDTAQYRRAHDEIVLLPEFEP